MSDKEFELYSTLKVLRNTILQQAVKIPLPVLDSIKEPMGEANRVLRLYKPEIMQDINETVERAKKAANHSKNVSKY